jgi:hypothetical protein
MEHLGKGMINRLQSPCKWKINTPSQIPVSTLPTFVTIAAREDLGRVPSAQKLEDPWVQHGRKNRGSTAINRKKKETTHGSTANSQDRPPGSQFFKLLQSQVWL